MPRLFAVLALVIGVACSGGSTGYSSPPAPPPPGPPPPPPPPPGSSTTITVGNNFFSPTPDTISAGTITFQWAAGAITHNVTWDTGNPSTPPNSGDKAANESYQALLVQGTYHYHCTHHGAMTGIIVVQ